MSELRRRLKARTQTLHDRVEAADVMSRLTREDLTLDTYRATLDRLHRLYVPLEAALARVPELAIVLPDLPGRMKAASLRADLVALGRPPDSTLVTKVHDINDLASALGTLYVLEGSTMGGRLIAKALRARHFITPETLHFFTHYGDLAGRYWQIFLAALETLPSAEHPRAERAAEETFALFLAMNEPEHP